MSVALKKIYLMRLKIKSLYDDLKGYWHYVVLTIILIALTIKYVYLGILLLFLYLYLFFKYRRLFYLCLLFSFLFIISFIVKEMIYQHEKNVPIKGYIIEIDNYDDINRYKIRSGLVNYYFYSEKEYQIGYKVLVNGRKEEYNVHYPNQFDYNNYLHYQNIQGVIKDSEVKVFGENFSIYSIHHLINNYITNRFTNNEATYLKTFITGDKSQLDMENIKKLNISHLFVISGLHVNIIIVIIDKIFSFFKVPKTVRDIICIIFTSFYVVVTSFLISVIRVFIGLLLKKILSIDGLDRLAVNALIVLIINPFYIFNISFILTYLISFFITIYKVRIKVKQRMFNYIINIIELTFFIQLFTLPITISMSPDFNLFSILISPFYIIFVTYLFLPLSIITIFIPFISSFYGWIIKFFMLSTNYFSQITFLQISLGDIHIIFKIIYLLLFYLALIGWIKKDLKYFSFLIIFFIGWYYKGTFQLNTKVYFFDLPLGESTLITTKNYSQVILVDSGDINNQVLTTILKNLGVRKIDYLIISHSDLDHIGGSLDVVKSINTDNLICGIYDDSPRIKELKQYIDNTYYVKKGDMIKKGEITINFLSPAPDYDYGNINDNSLVFIMTVCNKSFLFTGDISSKVEKEISNLNLQVDFLKVAHHGSNTSSSDIFIDNISFKYGIIMSGYNNYFGFPNDIIVNKIHNCLTTKMYYTIEVVLRNKNIKFKYYKFFKKFDIIRIIGETYVSRRVIFIHRNRTSY